MNAMRTESSIDSPPLDSQKTFWDTWNETWRFRDPDAFMQWQREVAVAVARRLALRDARILDVGCGTGWLGHARVPFGTVWAADLSEASIAEGRRRYPDVQFVCGDFLRVDLRAHSTSSSAPIRSSTCTTRQRAYGAWPAC